jgi:hypothetical protein
MLGALKGIKENPWLIARTWAQGAVACPPFLQLRTSSRAGGPSPASQPAGFPVIKGEGEERSRRCVRKCERAWC